MDTTDREILDVEAEEVDSRTKTIVLDREGEDREEQKKIEIEEQKLKIEEKRIKVKKQELQLRKQKLQVKRILNSAFTRLYSGA